MPLIGTGDWNDGMNTVGSQGKGESVWLGFFLYKVLMEFIQIAGTRGDIPFVEPCKKEATTLRQNIEQNGWDGKWYRRAYFDDGTPLGSERIRNVRLILLYKAGRYFPVQERTVHSHMAMSELDKRLVLRNHALIQLLDPPFDKSDLNPGYIKGYVPGVRENGGQYTHAAIWAAMAFAVLGDSKHAWELLGIINPVSHSKSREEIDIYKVEPYVMAADVYDLRPTWPRRVELVYRFCRMDVPVDNRITPRA